MLIFIFDKFVEMGRKKLTMKHINEKSNNREGKYLPNYILAFLASYFISSFIGAALFPIMNNIDYDIINFIVGLAAFGFLGILLWPLYSSYNFLTFFIFCVLSFLFINGTFEYIIGYDRKGGNLPVDEIGTLKRLKRARTLFACSIVVILVMAGIFIYERGEQVKEIDSIQTELDVAEENYERLKEQYNDIRSQGLEDRYDDGYDAGYDEGYDDGRASISSGSTSSSGSSSGSGSSSSVQTVTATVYITDTGSKYHRWGCQYLRESSRAILLTEARARGYTACSRCW